MSLRFQQRMEPREAGLMNALQLAYLGDAVWEMIVRFDLVFRKYNVHHMHRQAVDLVNAGAQARILHMISERLTEEEIEIVRRGRNAHPHHAAPRNQQPDDYAAATGFEALLGFLYLTGKDERIRELTQRVVEETADGGAAHPDDER